MIDIMSPLINEADNFANEILDIILINIVEPRKSQNKFAYELAEKLIVKTADSLESILKIVSCFDDYISLHFFFQYFNIFCEFC